MHHIDTHKKINIEWSINYYNNTVKRNTYYCFLLFMNLMDAN